MDAMAVRPSPTPSPNPHIGIQKVASASEAISLMNDSKTGLTASVWTNVEANAASGSSEAEDLFLKFVNELETGTVFLNRCDYLDPALSWVGVKDSGKGVSLSKYGVMASS
jgi:acyl-CoA reductase-like NAD-dependent aldehyde dehydrogenase